KDASLPRRYVFRASSFVLLEGCAAGSRRRLDLRLEVAEDEWLGRAVAQDLVERRREHLPRLSLAEEVLGGGEIAHRGQRVHDHFEVDFLQRGELLAHGLHPVVERRLARGEEQLDLS